jgi:hypothetical protein
MPTSPITGIVAGDTIDLANVADAAVTSDSFQNDQFTIVTSAGTYDLPFANLRANATFETAPDAAGGTDVALACFAAGTRIRTPSGDVEVECLRAADRVTTASGVAAPIIWVGRRMVDCRFHPHPEQIWPIRIAPGAFAAKTPMNELFLSPDHAIFFDGVLIPARRLINGRTVRQVRTDWIAYFHIELERHDVLLAESLPVESYLDTGNRTAFANGGRVVQLHPDFQAQRWEALGCAPLMVAGAVVERLRAHLHERAARFEVAPRYAADGGQPA